MQESGAHVCVSLSVKWRQLLNPEVRESNLYSASCMAAQKKLFVFFSVKHLSNLRLASMCCLSKGGTQIINNSCLTFGKHF